MERVRVLQIGLSSYPGGVENAIMNYFRFLDKNTVRFDFVCTEETLAYSREMEEAGSQIHYLPSPKRHMFRFAKELKRVINDGKYDIVHVNMLSAVNLFPVLFSKGTYAKRVIAHAHNSSLPGGGMKKIAHHILKHAVPLLTKDWMACSPGAAKWLFGEKRLPHVYILKNAISCDRFRFDEVKRKELRAAYGIQEQTPVIGHVGRFNEEKNHKYLLEVFTRVKQTVPEAKLLLVGTGPLLESVQNQAQELGIADCVIFVGGVSDTAPYYQMMDVFCMPSTFEGLGIVAIEAQASGVKCICSTGVPQEAIITHDAMRIDLNAPQTWESVIMDMLKQKRTAAVQEDIEQAGYSAALETKRLEDYYLK